MDLWTILGDLLCGLSDDFYAPDKGPLQGRISQELILPQTMGLAHEVFGLIQDMPPQLILMLQDQIKDMLFSLHDHEATTVPTRAEAARRVQVSVRL